MLYVDEGDFGVYFCTVSNVVRSIPSSLAGTIVQTATAQLLQQSEHCVPPSPLLCIANVYLQYEKTERRGL